MKHRTLILAGSYAKLSGLVLGFGMMVAAGLVGLGCLAEGLCVCRASEVED